jgi:hypothetical protein
MWLLQLHCWASGLDSSETHVAVLVLLCTSLMYVTATCSPRLCAVSIC